MQGTNQSFQINPIHMDHSIWRIELVNQKDIFLNIPHWKANFLDDLFTKQIYNNCKMQNPNVLKGLIVQNMVVSPWYLELMECRDIQKQLLFRIHKPLSWGQ